MPLTALALFSNNIDSPFIVPVAGCAMILGIVVAGIWSGIRNREIQSHERLAAIAKGVPVPPTVEELAILHGKPSVDSTRRRGNVRRAGIVLLGTAVGLAAFFVTLASILQERDVLCGAAVGLIPLGIGIALLIDARIQTREIDEASNIAPPAHLSVNDRSL
jgi:Domain of unknown function (DUF6249)